MSETQATKEVLSVAWTQRAKLGAEGDKLWVEGDKLRAEGDKLWAEAVIAARGPRCMIRWTATGCKLGTGETFTERT